MLPSFSSVAVVRVTVVAGTVDSASEPENMIESSKASIGGREMGRGGGRAGLNNGECDAGAPEYAAAAAGCGCARTNGTGDDDLGRYAGSLLRMCGLELRTRVKSRGGGGLGPMLVHAEEEIAPAATGDEAAAAT